MFNRKKAIFIPVFLITLTSFVHSLDRKTITADSAVDLAVQNNLTVKGAEFSLSAKRRSRETRFNAFIPDISAGSSLSRANEKPEIGDYHWNLSSSIQAQLILTPALFDGVRYVSADYENGLINYEDAVKILKRDTRKAFYSLLLLEENMKLLEKNIATAEKRYQQADINFRNGLVSELDRLRSRVSFEQLKPEYTELENSYKKSLLSFKQMIGLENETDIILEGEIDPETFEIEVNELIFSSLPDRLDVQKLISSIKLLKISRDSDIHRSCYPSLMLSYNKNLQFNNDPFSDPLFENPDDNWSDTGSFSLSLSFDLDSYIPGLKTDTDLKNKKDEIKRLETELASALQLAELEIRSFVMEIEKSAKKIEALRLNESLAQRAFELAEEGYNAGTVELLTLESASDDYQKARLDVLSEKFNYQSALLDLEYAVNSSLEAINENK